jgi:hypothetical protein
MPVAMDESVIPFWHSEMTKAARLPGSSPRMIAVIA